MEIKTLIATSTKLPLNSVIVVPNYDIEQQVLSFYWGKDYEKFSVAELIDDEVFLTMPDVVFDKLIRRFAKPHDKQVIVGLFAYLLLLSDEQREKAFAKLKKIIDNGTQECRLTFLLPPVWNDELQRTFNNPRYQSGRELMFITGESQTKNIEITLIGKKLLEYKPPLYKYKSFKDFIERIDNFPNAVAETIGIASLGDKRIAGLNNNIQQINTLPDFMRVFHGVSGLPESTLKWILQNHSEFDFHTPLKNYTEIRDEDEKRAFLFFLRKKVPPDSFLYCVLTHSDLTHNNFLQLYAVDVAVANLSNKKFAEERKKGLSEIEHTISGSLIAQFITAVRDRSSSDVLPWFGESKAEHCELLRRGGKYPVVETYLADYGFPTSPLADYFKQYRKLKVSNKVTQEWCEQVRLQNVDDVSSRNSLLAQHRKDKKTALLVVDAMGAEYLPFIVLRAQNHGLKIESHQVASVNLPTSTQFNKIDFPTCLPEIKALDNIVHYGARKNEQTEYCENIVEVLDVVFPQIFDAIASKIREYDRIILTADHGASRLAVLANELGFAKTLENPANEPPDDWRFTKSTGVSANRLLKDNDDFFETLDGQYICVRGYNRLSKQGGKQYELHGGYTPEEVLVPFVIFSRFTAANQPRTSSAANKPQIKEKDDFDI